MIVLFIDDDREDTDLYQEAINHINDSHLVPDVKIECMVENNCANIITYISGIPIKPDIIFLDIKMPLASGKECLHLLKNHSEFSEIPTVMLSTICKEDEIQEFKKMRAFDCIQKPSDFNMLVQVFLKFILSVKRSET